MYRDCLAAGLSTGSISHIRRTLSAAMTAAVNRGYLLRNPVRLAACPVYELPDVEPYDAEQSRKLVEATFTRAQRRAMAHPTRTGPAPGRGARTRMGRPRPRRRLGRHHPSTAAPAARARLPHAVAVWAAQASLLPDAARRRSAPRPGQIESEPASTQASRRTGRATATHQAPATARSAARRQQMGDGGLGVHRPTRTPVRRATRPEAMGANSARSPACHANAPTTFATPAPPCSCRPAWPTRWSAAVIGR